MPSILNVSWPQQEYNVEEDSKKLIDHLSESIMTVEEKPAVDDNNLNQAEVYVNDNGVIYDVFLTKTDVYRGSYGIYNFYVMQVIYDKARHIYFLRNRWGRMGEYGKHQTTPFGSKELCVAEFEKVFKSKTGNTWQAASSGDFVLVTNFQNLLILES